jgi:molybdopterin converting factor small subunit
MKVTVLGFGAVRQYLAEGSGRTEIEVTDGSCVGDVVDALGVPRRLAFSVLIDGVQASLDQEIHGDAEVTVMPPFAGG